MAKEAAKGGTTAFASAIGPCAPEELAGKLAAVTESLAPRSQLLASPGARCLGAHLEGPFVNPQMAGALPTQWMRPVVARELAALLKRAGGITLITVAPEVHGVIEAIAQLARRGIAVSLGHSRADASTAAKAVRAGARLVTHAFNGMRPFHHRAPGLLGAALLDDRLTAMVILDGVHIGPAAFQLLLRCKGPERVILETDSIRHQRPLRASFEGGAYYVPGPAWGGGPKTLAGSGATMIEAVRNAAAFAKISLRDAVRLASANPARAIGRAREFGSLEVGKRADLVVFDERFRVSRTLVGGRVVYQQGQTPQAQRLD